MKKRILLIAPSYKILKTSKDRAVLRCEPPVGLLNLASFVYEKGYECDIVNTAFDEINWEKIKNGTYLLVGLTIFIGEFLRNAKEISARIKEVNPSLPICFGGVMASLFPDRILEEYNVDFVVRYEGEYTLFELAQFLNGIGSLNNIKGLSYKEGNDVVHNAPRFPENNLDNFPIPKWELLGGNQRQIPYYFGIMSSKGCPYKCSFCYYQSVDKEIRDSSPVWRNRSARNIIAEIERIHQLTGTIVYTFGDDNFLVKKDRALEVFNYMRKNNFYVEQCVGHLGNLSDEVIEALGGVVQTVIYSIETASPRLIKLLNKKLDLDKVPGVNKKLLDKGVTTTHNFIVGLPTETDEDLRDNIEIMIRLKEINPYVRALTYLYFPLPFTPLHSYIEDEMGVVLPHTLKDYEDATFDSGREDGRKFRPWISKEDYDFLHGYCVVFEDAFQLNNMGASQESLKFLDTNSRLREMFKGIDKVNRPKVFYRPYVLDRVLRNEKIDLLNDLKRMVK